MMLFKTKNKIIRNRWFRRSILFFLSLCIYSTNIYPQANEDPFKSVEQIVELEVIKTIGNRLKPHQYYIDVQPTVDQNQTENQADLAFTNLKINIRKLQQEYQNNQKPNFSTFNFQVDIIFDNTVPDPLRNLIDKKIRRVLSIDDNQRRINIQKDDIFAPGERPVATEDLPELIEANKKIKELNDELALKIEESDISEETKERHNLEIERKDLEMKKKDLELQEKELELERAKIEAANKEGDLQAQLRAAQEAKKPQVQAKPKEEEKRK